MNPILSLIGIAGLSIGAILSYFITDYFADYRVMKAVQEEAIVQEKLCEGRIEKVRSSLSDDALAKVDAANASLSSLTRTPDNPAELQALCNQETACRDRTP